MSVIDFIERAHTTPTHAMSAPGRLDQGLLGLHKLAALLLLLAMSPFMLLLALVIWSTDGAPIFFGHYRVGRQGRIFRCLKFRSMRKDADQALAHLLATDEAARSEWARDQKLANDPRITLVGRFLRTTSLDELPQLVNVMRGDMCLVGPRPITPSELKRYGDSRWHYLSVHPGVTGLWQVSGRNKTTYDERVALDRRYVEQRSLWLDLKILASTVTVLMTQHGAV